MDFLANLINWQGIALLAVVFIPLERLLPLHRDQPVLRRDWTIDTTYLLLNGVLVHLGLLVVMTIGMLLLQAAIPAGVQELVVGQPLWLQVIEVLVIADLGFYAAHRLFHASGMMWRFHAVHHSIRDIDWLAAHRIHPIDLVLTRALSLIPCFILGFSPLALAIFFFVYQWHSVLLHANVRLNIGPLKWVIATPEFHRWHHANQVDAHDKNFGAQLTLWDAVFGTLYMPQGESPKRFGTDDPIPTSYPRQLLYPFRFKPAGDSDTAAEPSTA